MQNKLIYIHNIKTYLLEESGKEIWGKCISDGEIKKIEDIEKIGKPFNVITKHAFEDTISVHYQKDLIFKDVGDSLKIEKYLNLAEIEFKYTNPKNKQPQELGLIHGSPTNISSNTEIGRKSIGISRSIVPCQFYLIKDKIKSVS